jgi:hypothetical protein
MPRDEFLAIYGLAAVDPFKILPERSVDPRVC